MSKALQLSNWRRDEVIKKALAHAFDKHEEELKDFEHNTALEIYAAEFKDELANINALPDYWFYKTKTINANANGWRVDLSLKQPIKVPTQRNPNAPVPNGWWSSSYCFNVKSTALAEKIQQHAQAVEKLKEEKVKARNELRAKIYSISSLKRLQEAWPEGKPFYEWMIDEKPSTALSVDFADINAKFGLPIEE